MGSSQSRLFFWNLGPLQLTYCSKAMLLTFAGTSHSKYTTYLLEMLCNIELESSPALQEAIMKAMLVNVSGEAGKWQPGDIVQESLNKSLEPLVQHKNADFGSNAIHNVWSRNTEDINTLKVEIRRGAGLAKRSGRHKAPHERPEVKLLLANHKKVELHSRRPGRTYNDGRDVDDMRKGIVALDGGVLKAWINKSLRNRGSPESASTPDPGVEAVDSDDDDQIGDRDGEEYDREVNGGEELIHMTPGTITCDEDGMDIGFGDDVLDKEMLENFFREDEDASEGDDED